MNIFGVLIKVSKQIPVGYNELNVYFFSELLSEFNNTNPIQQLQCIIGFFWMQLVMTAEVGEIEIISGVLAFPIGYKEIGDQFFIYHNCKFKIWQRF